MEGMSMDALGNDNEKKIKRLTRVLYTGAVLIVASLLLLTYAITTDGSDSEPLYDPLGDYPVQIVTAQEILDDGTKAVVLSHAVEVEGVKCNDSSEPVPISGSITWQSVDPRGSVIQTGDGERTAEPGCTTTVFQNSIPLEVQISIQSQHNSGIDRPIWRITGVEYPLDRNGARGEPRRFQTENFVVLAGE
jgi:hypothetical protein